MPVPVGVNLQNLSSLSKDVSIVYVNTPFYFTWTFALCVIFFIIILIISGYAWFRISLRNRTNVIIHMPDKTRKVYSFTNFIGDIFKIETGEKTKDGTLIFHNYFFRPNALETGYFGRYIEYDFKVSEPRQPTGIEHKNLFSFISAILNTDLAVDLLLSQKFKDFVRAMLIIILVSIILNIIISSLPFFIHDTVSCTLPPTNETINTIRMAFK